MRRDQRDQLLKGFLAINAMLREEVKGLKRSLQRRTVEAKYNPNWAKQPRAPRGTSIGGQWVDGGGAGGAKRPQPIAPAEPSSPGPTPSAQQRFLVQDFSIAAGNDNAASAAISLARLRPIPWLLAVSPSGSTPQPRHQTYQVTEDLFLVVTETSNRRTASFQRLNSPAGRPANLSDIDYLPVEVRLEGDLAFFKGDVLAAAYGRHITGITWSPSAALPQIVPMTPEERRLEHNLREFQRATPEQVSIAIQQFRNSEAEGEPFMAALRDSGATPDQARRIRRALRFERSVTPYVPPTSGPLVDMFPGLQTAQGGQSVYAIDNVELPLTRAQYSEEARALVQEIQSIDPTYESDATEASNVSTGLWRAHIDALRLERAALLWRRRQEPELFQVEMIRFVQQRVDLAYPLAVAEVQAGRVRGARNAAVGNKVDAIVRQEVRDMLATLGSRRTKRWRSRRPRRLEPGRTDFLICALQTSSSI